MQHGERETRKASSGAEAPFRPGSFQGSKDPCSLRQEWTNRRQLECEQALSGSAGAGGGGEFGEQGVGLRPVDAGVGDALAVDEGLAWDEFLRAGHQIALHHDAEDVWVASGNLAGDIVAGNRLAAVVLVAVGGGDW